MDIRGAKRNSTLQIVTGSKKDTRRCAMREIPPAPELPAMVKALAGTDTTNEAQNRFLPWRPANLRLTAFRLNDIL
jgi:hypothetical protein